MKEMFYLPPTNVKELILRKTIAETIREKIFGYLNKNAILSAVKWFVLLRKFDSVLAASDFTLALIRCRYNEDMIDVFMQLVESLDPITTEIELREELNKIMEYCREKTGHDIIFGSGCGGSE